MRGRGRVADKRVNVLHVWTGGDAEGRAVRDMSALALTAEQEAVLAEMFKASLFHVYRDMDNAECPDPNVHIEIRACMPLDAPRG